MSWSSRGECLSVGVKSHVLYSRLLSPDDYWNFLSSDTVTEIGQKLLGTAYEETMSSLAADPRRRDLESAVKSTLFAQAENFVIHLSSPRDIFFRMLMYRHEADNLKSVFRYIASRRENREDLRRRLYMWKHSRISYDNALSSRDFMELSETLKDTGYHKVLAEPLRRLHTGEEHSLFPLEMALDIFIELSLYKTLKKLEQGERDRLLPIFGARVDLYNLYILYRAMKFYNMTPEETLNRLMPVRYRVTIAFLRELARLESVDDLAEALKSRFADYSKLISSASGDKNPQLAFERNINRHVYAQARKVFGGGPPGFHTAVSYYILKEFEIMDIIRIIEYVRYGYDRRDAASYLTRPIDETGVETRWQ